MDLEWVRRRIAAGERVRAQSHPATDAFIFGDRYGWITKVTRTRVHVKMDRSGVVRRFHPDNVLDVDI